MCYTHTRCTTPLLHWHLSRPQKKKNSAPETRAEPRTYKPDMIDDEIRYEKNLSCCRDKKYWPVENNHQEKDDDEDAGERVDEDGLLEGE